MNNHITCQHCKKEVNVSEVVLLDDFEKLITEVCKKEPKHSMTSSSISTSIYSYIIHTEIPERNDVERIRKAVKKVFGIDGIYDEVTKTYKFPGLFSKQPWQVRYE